MVIELNIGVGDHVSVKYKVNGKDVFESGFITKLHDTEFFDVRMGGDRIVMCRYPEIVNWCMNPERQESDKSKTVWLGA